MSEIEKHSSWYWALRRRIDLTRVEAFDGWDRRNFEDSMEERITEREFHRRLCHATIFFNDHILGYLERGKEREWFLEDRIDYDQKCGWHPVDDDTEEEEDGS